MMQYAIDRRRQTRGGFAASLGAHVLAILLLGLMIGHQAVQRLEDELTEISYIEARYGEDVAAKVKLKDPMLNKPAPPGPVGPGITTDSAVKPKEAPPGPPAPVLAPELPPATPRPQPQLAQAAAPQIAPVTKPVRTLEQAPVLDARDAPAPARRVIDTDKLKDSLAGKLVEAQPRTLRPTPVADREAFKPVNGNLRDRGGRGPSGADPVVSAAPRQDPGTVVEAPASLGGASLSSRASAGSYVAPASSLAPAGVTQGSMAGGAVLDIAGPASGGGGGARKGRKTILNYGSGGGGGGGLVGRSGRLAEPPASRAIVNDPAPATSDDKAQVAEAKVSAEKGVGMTITGQIAGRKILHRVAPGYSDAARRNGWEGVVAVRFTVLPDGRVKDNMFFEQTSVHRDLNQAAMAAIKQFRFASLPSDQSAVEQWGVITIVFRLN